ncbi:hypothetical protein MMC18_001942 [Xylographa bjoerkii]|nr:hypothetical protein [Xylographa bjoerkii]
MPPSLPVPLQRYILDRGLRRRSIVRPFSTTTLHLNASEATGAARSPTSSAVVSAHKSLNSPPSDAEGVTGQVCNWIYSVQLQDVPEQIKTNAKYLSLGGIACAIVGAQLPWSRVAARAIMSWESPGDCTVFGWNKRLNPLAAATLNSTFIQGFELDDVHAEAPWHANSIILPTLFAAAEHANRGPAHDPTSDGPSFLLSTIVGFEIGSRVGHALYGSDMLSQGWHSGAVFGPPAAAAAVSKLLRLSPEKTEDAIGTACTQSSGLMAAQYESMSKRMQHGFAARNSLFSALVSREEYTGIDEVFERPYGGFLAAFGQGSTNVPPYLEKNSWTDWTMTGAA